MKKTRKPAKPDRNLPYAADTADIRISMLAVSMCGHDRGRLYAVVGEDNDRLCLCDGRLRTLEKPKWKNIRHVQKIIHFPKEIKALMENIHCDSDIIYLLRCCRKVEEEINVEEGCH